MKNFIHGKLIYGHSLQAVVLYAADWQPKVTIAWHWSFYSAVSCLSNQLTQILIGSSISQIAISETSCKQPPPVSDHLSLTTRVAAYRRFHCIYFMVLYTMWYYTCMCYNTISTMVIYEDLERQRLSSWVKSNILFIEYVPSLEDTTLHNDNKVHISTPLCNVIYVHTWRGLVTFAVPIGLQSW